MPKTCRGPSGLKPLPKAPLQSVQMAAREHSRGHAIVVQHNAGLSEARSTCASS